ncbi:MAG TPA: FAD-dependent oxidoreductase [Candidatus Limnocylindrales bacterium]|nr:FAD-dependent oxidoreductase [Candidatus Limnocylindrales bacterium]
MGTRYVIVGNGAAGATAAVAIRRQDAAADIRVIGAENLPFYSRPGLAYLLTGMIPEKRLFARPDSEYRRADIRRTIGTVQAIEPRSHRLDLADGEVVRYDRLLLAVGARAVRPSLPGSDLEGVVTLDNLADARRILHLARRARRACVVGGGITAIELAEGLAANGVETHYLMRGDRYWGSVLDPRESALVEERLTEDGIQIHRGEELAQVHGHKGRVTAVETQSGASLDCQVLAVAIGTAPRLELAQSAGLATGRGIWANPDFATSDPDIFVAGDAAEVLDPTTGKRGIDSLWSVAIEQGRAAAANMSGTGQPYRRPAPFNVTRIGGVTTTLIGAVGSGGREGDLVTLARGDSHAWREQLDAFAVISDAGANHLRLMLGEDRIVGAVVMGDQTLSRPLQHLIRDRVDIRAIRDRLIGRPSDVGHALAALMEKRAASVGAV